ncbi:MAG: hypothetical protein A2341_17200 [Deltaproteobacteria bacterium RIFOXYB12_FULL_58_9]|nr:MAG: hypothetical protein A2341_17200 [Deltaproteobacteria bacterium RIFOXYB12_FULL_58_9]
MFEQMSEYLLTGGFVMPPLMGLGVVLWTLLGLRWQFLRWGFAGDLRLWCRSQTTIHGNREELRRALEATHRMSEMQLVRFRTVIRSLCAAAPLLGLLGTVSGMIETFSSLTGMQSFAQNGGVAGGISEALISTQMGLFVAVSGIIASRYLDSRERALRNEIDQAREELVRLWDKRVEAAT